MASTNTLGLTVERVQNKSESDLADVLCSSICEGVLWKPVSCQECETHFCSMCIEKWFEKHPRQCPLRCSTFTERNCSKFVARQLAKLQIICINRGNGCSEVVPYEALEKHELQCEYQLERCPACAKDMLRKDRQQHQSECSSVEIRRESHQLYPREMLTTLHQSDTHTAMDEIRQLQRRQDELTQLLTQGGIIPNHNDETLRRTVIQSTTETGKLPASRVINPACAAASSGNGYLCLECKNVAWEPVSCEHCRATFCKACSPWAGVIGRMVGFFSSNKGHGPDKCQRFEAGTLSQDFMKSISQAQFRCAYAPNGCPAQLEYDGIVGHEKTCSYEMIPCRLCHMLLSKRSPVTEHKTRACFQHMRDRNPAPIQQQFMVLLAAAEKANAENQRLQEKIKTLEEQLRVLDTTCVKKEVKK